MTHLSSASVAASYGPPGSSTASMITAISILIPIMAILLMVMASPQVRKELRRVRSDYRRTFYGPEKKKSPAAANPESRPETSPSRPEPQSEFLTFDHSIYIEDDDEE